MRAPDGFTPNEWARVEAALAQRNLAGLVTASLWIGALIMAILGNGAGGIICFLGGCAGFMIGPGQLPPDLDTKVKNAIKAGII